MRGFRLTVYIQRLCMHPLTPLDGSIAGMINTGEKPNLDMIATHDGVPMASFPLFDSVHSGYDSILRDYRKHLVNGVVPDALMREKTQMKSVSGSKSKSYHRGNTYRFYNPHQSKVTYYFTGDEAVVANIIRRTGAIGALTGKGYGTLQVDYSGNSVYLSEVDTPLCGILDENQRLVRPIPYSLAKELNIDPATFSVHMGRYEIPYGPHDVRRFGLTNGEIAVPVMGFEHG